MGLKLVTAPANDPLTLAQAKAHLRVEHTDDDALIAAMLSACIQHVDGPRGFLGRALIDQTWDLYLDSFPCGPAHHRHGHHRHHGGQIEIPLPPLIEVVGVFYTDTGGTEQEFSTADYVVDTASQPGRVVLVAGGSWPTTIHQANAVRIRFRAGYIDASSSPATDNVDFPIKAAILLHLGNLYRNRETVVVGQVVSELPWAAEQLLRPYRVKLGLA